MKWQINKFWRESSAALPRAWFFSLGLHALFFVLLISVSINLKLSPAKKLNVASVVFKESATVTNAAPHHEPSVPTPAPGKNFRSVKKKIPAQKKVEQAAIVLPPTNDFAAEASPVETLASSSGSETGENAAHVFRPMPTLINKDEVKVPYPELARQLMIEGIVKMRLTVSDAGRVIDAQILSGPYFGLRNAALVVARKLFFLPATDEHGTARTANVDHEVVFRLHQRS